MKIISTNNIYNIFDDSMRTYDLLPVQPYVVNYHPEKGFYLEKYGEISVPEKKVYGVHLEKIEKVLRTFTLFDRNLGVLLSGEKGIGKTLFVKLLAIEAMKRGMPVIVINRYYPGIDSYLENITQEVVVLFDEFEKHFGEDRRNEDFNMGVNYSGFSHQYEILGLFDGISAGKKLFILTCNNTMNINHFLIDRPGRIHYHFKFAYPSPKEITDYLNDNLKEEYKGEIRTIINYSIITKMSYDTLRAIVFEINMGLPTEEAVRDLNISKDPYSSPEFDVSMHFKRGNQSAPQKNRINFFDDDLATITLNYRKKRTGRRTLQIQFSLNDLVFDDRKLGFTLPADKIQDIIQLDECSNNNQYESIEEILETDGFDYLIFYKRYS